MPVVLFDLPSKDPCKSWSLNPWKTRLALNFKGIDYETRWVEYPDVAPTFKELGVSPNPEGPASYTIPTVMLDDKVIMDSWNIAQALEARNPTPSLQLDHPMFKRLMEVAAPTLETSRVFLIPEVPERLLNEKSKPYFYETRAQRLGAPLKEWQASHDLDKEWDKVAAGLKKMAELLKETPGPYFLGDTVSYADFVIVSWLHFARRLDMGLYEKMVAVDDSLGELYKWCEKWLARDAS